MLARRLVEAGVRVVTLSVGCWDHHSGPPSGHLRVVPALPAGAGPQRVGAGHRPGGAHGLLDDVLVVVLGEFGRTPKISSARPRPRALGRRRLRGSVRRRAAGGAGGRARPTARAERASVGRTMHFQNVIGDDLPRPRDRPEHDAADFGGRPPYPARPQAA